MAGVGIEQARKVAILVPGLAKSRLWTDSFAASGFSTV
jgi:hypothetical protein